MLTKEDILKEIRRTTKENGGVPLGISRFGDETGITDTEWQKYWPRFNDAKREAGVKETPFVIPAFSDEHVFEEFILLIRELERIPVTGELVVKHAQDSNFPSVAVFQRLFSRLGGIHKFLTALLKYAENKNYEDIVKLCGAHLKKVKIIESETDANYSTESGVGYVYLLKSSLMNAVAYKIGKTKNIEQRLKQLRQASNIDELLHQIQTDDIEGVEQYWLNRFTNANKRLRPNKPKDEWFKLNSSDIKAFKRWKRIF